MALPDGRRGEKTQGSLTWIIAVTLICLQALLQVVLGDVRLCRKWLVVVHMCVGGCCPHAVSETAMFVAFYNVRPY